jgi:Putative F0F1-ATPase subunit (ATPase_gene1).
MVKETDISANDTGDSGVMMILARTMIGTMWRIFLPTIGLTLLGLWLDNVSGTKMRWLLAGIISGAIISVILVALQIAKIKQQELKK